MPRLWVPVAVALTVVVLAVVGAVLMSRDSRPGPPLGAVLDGADRRALAAVPMRRGPGPPPADPAVDFTDPQVVARTYLAAARSATPDDRDLTRLRAAAYAAPRSPTASVGVVVLDPPPPGQVRTAGVTALDLVAAAEDDGRRGYRATVAIATGPPDGAASTTVTTAYVVLARQPDGRWLVVADASELDEGDV
ncbi:MAG: hypothetical protein JNM77_00545 [Pseudonocardia sp.]|nr:hypothetical protein [Pseudonocardia sp.]